MDAARARRTRPQQAGSGDAALLEDAREGQSEIPKETERGSRQADHCLPLTVTNQIEGSSTGRFGRLGSQTVRAGPGKFSLRVFSRMARDSRAQDLFRKGIPASESGTEGGKAFKQAKLAGDAFRSGRERVNARA